MVEVRPAGEADFAPVSALLARYMAEAYGDAWHGNLAALRRDSLGVRFHLYVAARSAQLIGLIAWEAAYDLHHCLTGGHVLDLYVEPAHRGRAVALQLLAAACRHIHSAGGTFLRGHAVESGSAAKLYDRVAARFGSEHILGGRAFRHVATLSCVSARAVARQLPDRAWNDQP